ncbi:MAG: hypothetical protein U9N85_11980 [Bacteroidota bacterium]|nr:hypothetical protein [Bacteroidota bacterium]
MIFRPKTITTESIIDYSEILENNDKIISVSIDSRGVNTLIIHSEPAYRTEDEMFPVIKSENTKNYTFIRHDLEGNEILRTVIKDEYYNFHYVNYLPTDEILLICGRSLYESETEIDKNARIYNTSGELVRNFIAGDGIQGVKIDSKGNIWTSYFDEGIFGSNGWDNPIGRSGLVCWSKDGEKVREFEPTDGLDHMSDCYAMNIDSEDNTWFYYYTGFPLVKLNSSNRIEFWKSKIAGSSSISILGDRILMDEGYDRNNFKLFEIKGKKLKKLKKVKFRGTENTELDMRNYIPSFGSHIGFYENNKIYLTNMNEIK